MLIAKNCENCGKEFTFKKSQGLRRKYCSYKCGYESCTSKKSIPVICSYCNKEFQAYVVKGYPRSFCSNRCKDLNNRKFDYEKLLKAYDDGMTWAEIMSEYKISRGRLGEILQKYGKINRRPRKSKI